MSNAIMRVCLKCATKFTTKPSRVAAGKGKFCSPGCRWQHEREENRALFETELPSRFWERVNKGGPTPGHVPELGPCWLWTGSFAGYGYGTLQTGADTHTRAHRIAYELLVGQIPEGMVVRHRCDNPPCVNPDHLLLGSQRDNVHDTWKRNRASPPPVMIGLANRASKLSPDAVLEIRRRWAAGETQTALGLFFGVTQTTIGMIVHGRLWRSLLPEQTGT